LRKGSGGVEANFRIELSVEFPFPGVINSETGYGVNNAFDAAFAGDPDEEENTFLLLLGQYFCPFHQNLDGMATSLSSVFSFNRFTEDFRCFCVFDVLRHHSGPPCLVKTDFPTETETLLLSFKRW